MPARSNKPGLSLRTAELLHAIVRTYIESGEPVASKDVVLKKDSLRGATALSPATVRNEMAELTEQGYLAQPHSSAGRIPTKKAFEHYIESLAIGRIANAELERLRNELRRPQTVEAQVEQTSRVLSAMTQNIAIAAAIPASSQKLEQVDFVLLPDRRVLMIVATKDHMVRQQVVSIEGRLSQDDLHSIRNYLNREFHGWAIDDIRRELERRLAEERATYDAILSTLTRLYNKGLLDFGLAPEIHLEGASNIVGLDLSLTRDTMRELFRALEEKQRLLELLDVFVEQPAGGTAIQVGLDDLHPAWKDLSLVGAQVTLRGGMSTKIAVLGPLRMNYSRVISAVQLVGRALDGLEN